MIPSKNSVKRKKLFIQSMFSSASDLMWFLCTHLIIYLAECSLRSYWKFSCEWLRQCIYTIMFYLSFPSIIPRSISVIGFTINSDLLQHNMWLCAGFITNILITVTGVKIWSDCINVEGKLDFDCFEMKCSCTEWRRLSWHLQCCHNYSAKKCHAKKQSQHYWINRILPKQDTDKESC